MGDDLSAFFAKKKAKDKKKKGVVNLDDMGQHLERKAKRQEERDRVEAEEDKHTQDDDTFIKKTASEESEWLDYNEDFGQNRLEGLGIKDMNLTEQTEAESQEEAVDSEGTVPVETVKTWNVPESKQAAPEIIPTASELEAAKQHTRPVGGKYVPPSSRQRTEQTVRPRLDVNNQEMFPTIAAADQIEKIKKDEEKKKVEQPAASSGTYVAPRAPWANVNAGRDVNSGREDAMNAARALAATAPASTPPPRAPEPAPQAAPANPNRYIPPHLRNKT